MNENQQQTFDTYLAQSATIQRLERLLELSTNMLSKLVNTNATIGTTTPGSLEASLASRTVDFAEGVNSQPVSFTRDRSISRATDTDIAAAGAGQKGTSG